MARVATELGFTTMSLYRYVANKEELFQLMWDASALGAKELVIEGDSWRSRLRTWAIIQRDMLDRHPWVTHLPMAAPPAAPNSLHFVERGLETMDETGLPDSEKLRVLGLLSSYTLSEGRMADDARRAALAATADQGAAEPSKTDETAAAEMTNAPPELPGSFEGLLRELVDERTYPRLYALAWSPGPDDQPSEYEQFLFGIDLILDGVQVLIDRAKGGDG
jgi:AcrR family transcriptional regulator